MDEDGRARRARSGRDERVERGADRRSRRRRSSALALAGVEVADAGEHHAARGRSAPRRGPRPTRPQAPARHMPPRKPLGVVSGVLKSPCASSQSTRASGRWPQRRPASVVSAIEQSADEQHREAARRRARRPPGRRPRAGSRATSRRSSSQPRVARLPGRADEARLAPSRSASRGERLRAARAAGSRSEVRQQHATTGAHRPFHAARASRRTPSRPRRCPRSTTRASAARAGSRARRRTPCPAGGTSRPCPAA